MTTQSSPRRYGPILAIGAIAAVVVVAGCSDTPSSGDNASTIVRSTTNIAGAGVVGNDRDTIGLCAAPAPLDETGVEGTVRPVGHSEGITDVPADPARIVVLSPAALDASCALGVWERVVGASTLDPEFRGDGDQELYLGTGIAEIPGVGPVGTPDFDVIASLSPDLILGSDTLGSDAYDQLAAIAPTVFTSSDQGWKGSFLQSAAALGRGGTAFDELARFSADAERVGRDVSASQTQASVVRFLPDSFSTDGPDTFASEVLAEIGVQRPPSQRDTSTSGSVDDASAAEGDIVYVRFDGDAGEEYGRSVMTGSSWEELGSARDGRIFAVDDTVWSGSGVIAARAILADVSGSLNGYVS